MIYVEHKPDATIKSCVRLLWYCKAPGLLHTHERILPRGEMQIIVNLAGDALTNHSLGQDGAVSALPSCIVVGPRGRYDLVDTQDLKELVGVVFWPGGAAPFLREDAGAFFERFIALEDVLSCREIRTLLQGQPSPSQKLRALERWLEAGLTGRLPQRNPVVIQALNLLRQHSVRDAARLLSISERRLHQIMKTEVGLSPKVWSRVQRFQHAISLLQARTEPRWEQLALACGFYDQSHFCNEFKAFSGIDPSTYSNSPRLWANHIAE
ncbi:helix-turn-helix domain-containing protein [Granulicella sp. S156]|jgi:AraC-like DNA-binding protein|uniref:helix-turn-helix domain-containing protein n=1 Tax=Granulicella sp. S156 TaxID=1747224 RepID=UPI00131D94C7|nr:helix-turn-helix domain-containing protein [Granulicella sp. S156]